MSMETNEQMIDRLQNENKQLRDIITGGQLYVRENAIDGIVAQFAAVHITAWNDAEKPTDLFYEADEQWLNDEMDFRFGLYPSAPGAV